MIMRLKRLKASILNYFRLKKIQKEDTYQIKRMIEKWARDNKLTSHKDMNMSLYYTLEKDNTILNLYSNWPGVVVGYHGKCISDLKERLEDQGYKIKVTIVDIGSTTIIK